MKKMGSFYTFCAQMPGAREQAASRKRVKARIKDPSRLGIVLTFGDVYNATYTGNR